MNDDKMKYLYVTNNIVEAIHSKLNKHLAKSSTSILNFINAISNILNNDSLKDIIVKLYDFKKKSLILIIKEENLNYKLKWILKKK